MYLGNVDTAPEQLQVLLQLNRRRVEEVLLYDNGVTWFQVLVLLAFLEPSMAPWFSLRCTRVIASCVTAAWRPRTCPRQNT